MKITPQQLAQESMFHIKEIYLPYLGKCECSPFATEDGEPVGNRVINTHCRVLNCSRKDEEGTRYDIGEHFTHVPGSTPITINLRNGTVAGAYIRTWIGGKVEKINFKYKIDSIRAKRDIITEAYDVTITTR